MERRDVVVVGAGPAGAAVAQHLAQLGHDVLIVERAALPRDKPCAEYLSPAVVKYLAELGVWDDLREHAPKLTGFTIFPPSGPPFRGTFPAVPGLPQTGTAIPRARLDHALAVAAVRAGAELRDQCRVIDLSGAGERIVTVLDSTGAGRRIAARLVVGADGLHSTIARRLRLAQAEARPRRVSLVTHMAGVDRLDEWGEMHVAGGPVGVRYCGVAPLGNGLANVALVVPCAEAPALRGRPDAFLHTVIRSFPHLGPRLDRAVAVKPVMAIGPLAWRTTRAATDGVLLVGDAAGFFDPYTGQGIYRALRGAELAAKVADGALRRDDCSIAALAGYDRQRAEFRGSWAAERLVHLFLRWPALFQRAAARLACRSGLADRLVGVTGDLLPARTVLNPLFLGRVLI